MAPSRKSRENERSSHFPVSTRIETIKSMRVTFTRWRISLWQMRAVPRTYQKKLRNLPTSSSARPNESRNCVSGETCLGRLPIHAFILQLGNCSVSKSSSSIEQRKNCRNYQTQLGISKVWSNWVCARRALQRYLLPSEDSRISKKLWFRMQIDFMIRKLVSHVYQRKLVISSAWRNWL